MSVHTTLAPFRRPAKRLHAADRKLENQLRRFDHRLRTSITVMANHHSRLADLAFSFPALLFALCVRRKGFPVTAVIDAVIRGDGLKETAQLAGLPLWLRKLPPEAFSNPIPRLPDGEVFRRRIGNALPKGKKACGQWLNTVAFTARWGDEDFVAWAAAQVATPGARVRHDWARLSLWAWYSLRPGLTAHGLIATPWTPSMTLDKAGDASRGWLRAVNQHLAGLPDSPLILPATPREVDGFAFQPILGREAIIAEADAMQNCMRNHLDEVAGGTLQFWSVRRNGARHAVLAVERSDWNPIPRIGQIEAKANEKAPMDVWRAAAKWFSSYDPGTICAGMLAPDDPAGHLRAWRALWKPYWLDRRKCPTWLPHAPNVGWQYDVNFLLRS